MVVLITAFVLKFVSKWQVGHSLGSAVCLVALAIYSQEPVSVCLFVLNKNFKETHHNHRFHGIFRFLSRL